MAGGMHRRGADRMSLHERIRGTPPVPAGSTSPQAATPAEGPSPIRHCWVIDGQGRLPGLLLEWRRTASGWQGRVVHPLRESGAWVVVEEWLPAAGLQST